MDAIPRGIEVLVKKASVDPAFKAVLMADRSKAAGEIGLSLDPSEVALLDLVPAAQLSAIVAATRVDPSKKPAFLGKAAAVMLVALGASAVTSQAQKVAGLGSAPPTTTQASQPATTSAPAVSAEEVKKLVAQLDAEDFATREKAQKALMDLGPGVVPMLEESLKDSRMSLEVFTQVRRVIRKLQAAPEVAASLPVAPRDFPRPVLKEGIAFLGGLVVPVNGAPVKPIASPLPATGRGTTAPSYQPTTQASSLPDTTSAPAVSADEVKKLLAQLDSEDFASREKAQKALMDLGLGVVPMLEDSLKDTKLSLEVQTRIQRVIRNLRATTQPVRPTDVRPTRGDRVEEVAGAKADIP